MKFSLEEIFKAACKLNSASPIIVFVIIYGEMNQWIDSLQIILKTVRNHQLTLIFWSTNPFGSVQFRFQQKNKKCRTCHRPQWIIV